MKVEHVLSMASIAAFSAQLALGLQWSSYDAHTHAFLASHYVRWWFNSYDPRWYGGFSAMGYPPLFHQLVALLSFPLGIQVSYSLVSLVAYLVAVGGTYSLARAQGLANSWTIPILLSMPSLFLFSFVFGQQPTILATGLAFISASRLARWLEGGRSMDLLSASLAASLALMSHHVTAALLIPLLALAVYARARSPARLAAWALLSLMISTPIIYGLAFFIHTTPAQSPIPHATRENILTSMDRSMMFFWGIYGFLPALLPYLISEARSDRRTVPLLTLSLILLLLGLGGSTPLPRILFWRLWDVLTYEKFSLWSSLALGVLAAHLLGRVEHLHRKYLGRVAPRGLKSVLGTSVVVALLASAIVASHASTIAGTQPPRPDIHEVASYLDWNCNSTLYLTLGMGTWSRELSYMVSHARTLDGGYNTARRLPVLAESGVENIDSAKHFPNGLRALRSVLARWHELGLGCILVEDPSYDKVLEGFGFREVAVLGEGVPVGVWMSPGVPSTLHVRVPRPSWMAELLWGIWPSMILAVYLAVEVSTWRPEA